MLTRLKNKVKRLLGDFRPAAGRLTAPAAPAKPTGVPAARRFLSDQPRRTEEFLRGANEYVANLDPGSYDYLYVKPYDPLPGNDAYYLELYQVLNILRAMDMPGGGRVLEVGSGPGWVTEILMSLGFDVDAIEPSADMIRIAGERIEACKQHNRLKTPGRVTFHETTLEECTLPEGAFDGVLFHESLHHIIDEDAGLTRTFQLLKAGGIIGVSGDPVWWPGNRNLEEFLEEEMRRFNTLENPYSIEYLDYLLAKHGFVDVVHYHGVNGLFPLDMENRTVKEVAQFPASGFNTVTARRPGCMGRDCPTTAEPSAKVKGEIHIESCRHEPEHGKVYLTVNLTNTGPTAWLHRRPNSGAVTLALRQGAIGKPGFQEASPRQRLSQTVLPGDGLTVEAMFRLPSGCSTDGWQLDLVNEGNYWFSQVGCVPQKVDIRPA